jgi:hypothetical protein
MRTEGYADRDDGDFGAPTPERRHMLNGHLIERPIYDKPDGASRVPIGTGYHVASTVMKMHIANPQQITHGLLKAAHIFYGDYNHGMLSPRVSGRYGVDLAMAGLGTGGTPLSQVKESEDPETRKREELKEEPQIARARRYAKACEFIGHRATAYWLTAIVCEIPVNDDVKPPSLEDVGRAWMGYQCQKRAQASGATLIKSGLERLADFYGIRE